ncbi:MAG: DsbA family protein [Chloroflexi bacterium]|nr:DsbA family protein [Chloroflexota bacterium]
MTQPPGSPKLPDIPGLPAQKPGRSSFRFRPWMVAMGVLLLIAAAGFLYYQFAPLDAPIPAEAGKAYVELEQGTTEQGFPRLGRADAPVVVEEFSSYACPHCRDFHHEIFPTLLDEIAAGQVQFVVIPIAHIGMGAKTAAQGALCAGEQGRYWTMHDVLYDWQKRFVAMTFNKRRIVKGAENLGLDRDQFDQCMDSSTPDKVIKTARQEFDQRRVSGTPTFFINGQRVQDYQEFDTLGTLADQLRTTSP